MTFFLEFVTIKCHENVTKMTFSCRPGVSCKHDTVIITRWWDQTRFHKTKPLLSYQARRELSNGTSFIHLRDVEKKLKNCPGNGPEAIKKSLKWSFFGPQTAYARWRVFEKGSKVLEKFLTVYRYKNSQQSRKSTWKAYWVIKSVAKYPITAL